MINIDLAKKLRDLGLEWQPKWGDYFQMIVLEKSLTTCLIDEFSVNSIRKETSKFRNEKRLWLPRLDQLLEELEKRGYLPKLEKGVDGILIGNGIYYEVSIFGKNRIGKSWEEAAAKVLVMVLEEEQKKEGESDA
jgi:hypothetical protein